MRVKKIITDVQKQEFSNLIIYSVNFSSQENEDHQYAVSFYFLFFFKDFIYFIHREAETEGEGEVGSMQGVQCGTRSQVARITPQAAGGAKPLRHWGCPNMQFHDHFTVKGQK